MCTKQRSDHLPLSFFLTRALTLLWPALFLTTHPFFLLAFFFLQGEGVAEKIWAQGISLTSISLFFFCTMPLSCPKKKDWPKEGCVARKTGGQKKNWPKKGCVVKKMAWQKKWWTKKRIGGQRNGGQKKELVDMELVDMLQQQRLQR